MPYIDDTDTLNQEVTELLLEITTVVAGDADSDDTLYANVIFADGTRLFDPHNFSLGSPPDPGDAKQVTLPVPSGLGRTLGSIAEVYLRKSGDDGWFAGSVLLFANGHQLPLIGSRNVNQFLDNDDAVLQLRDWSTASFCVAPTSSAKHPLPRSGYRVLGPVLGQVSATSAVVLYRVDREGLYRFRARDAITNALVLDETVPLEPTGRFELSGLQPDRRYTFELGFVRAGVESPIPEASGSFRTYPAEQTRGRFSFAFGSCANPREQVAQGSWTAIRALSESPPPETEPVRLFIHLGDTFYFYDDMTEETVQNVESMHAAHVSMRRHIEFLDMAKVVPCCGIWDDHDFAGDNSDSTDISSALRADAVKTWSTYWGNDQPISSVNDLGLTTRVSHGRVDIYLLDGRFSRDRDDGVFFGMDLVRDLLVSIRRRGVESPRVVVLATGSNWNHASSGKENYGDSVYSAEREELFGGLASLMGTAIQGLLLISGDDHINEIYHVELGSGRMAPEFVSSPLTLNSDLESDGNDIEGERVASFPSKGNDGKRGFATLTIDTSNSVPDGNWTATIRYYLEAAASQYHARSYVVSNGQFGPV